MLHAGVSQRLVRHRWLLDCRLRPNSGDSLLWLLRLPAVCLSQCNAKMENQFARDFAPYVRVLPAKLVGWRRTSFTTVGRLAFGDNSGVQCYIVLSRNIYKYIYIYIFHTFKCVCVLYA